MRGNWQGDNAVEFIIVKWYGGIACNWCVSLDIQ